MNFPIEVYAGGKKLEAVLQDLSRTGMFLRTPELPLGSVVHVAMCPAGKSDRVVTAGKVMHALDEADARTLGRTPGVGIQFRDPVSHRDEQFAHAVAQMLARHIRVVPPVRQRIVVADRHTRLLERLSTALGDAGFAVAIASTGMEALGACLAHQPDVLLVDRGLPVIDGFQIVTEIARQPKLAGIPVIVTSYDPADAVPALELGALDFVHKPFTADEIILRARRLARMSPRLANRIVLRGSLAEIALPTLLTMLEQSRKSGRLSLTRDDTTATIDLVEGGVITSPEVVLGLLDWTSGTFELTATHARTADVRVTRTPVTHLLLEHARLRDESSRPHRAPRLAKGTEPGVTAIA